jgi:hypothetical protein
MLSHAELEVVLAPRSPLSRSDSCPDTGQRRRNHSPDVGSILAPERATLRIRRHGSRVAPPVRETVIANLLLIHEAEPGGQIGPDYRSEGCGFDSRR